MKKIFVFLGLVSALVLGASCSKELTGGVDGGELVAGAGETLLTVRFDSPATKVASQTATNEKAIRNVQVFIFRAGSGADAGMLETAKSAGFDVPLEVTTGTYSGLQLKSSTGTREVWAVINDSQDRTSGANAVQTKTEFLAQVHDLENSTSSKLLMVGHSNPEGTTPAIQFTEGAMPVTVPVHRLAASVVLESVTNSFDSPGYQKSDIFRVEACYLINVPGRINFGETSEPSSLDDAYWYAKMAAETSASRMALTYDSMSNSIVNYGSAYTTKHTFYNYPNNCAQSVDASWSKRGTLLVVEASIKYATGWQLFYYPIKLDQNLESNKQYHVNLTIHRPGSLDPNKPVTFAEVTPTITVSNWETGSAYNPEI